MKRVFILCMALALLLLAGCSTKTDVSSTIAKGIADSFVAAIDAILDNEDLSSINTDALEKVLDSAKDIALNKAFPELFSLMEKTITALQNEDFAEIQKYRDDIVDFFANKTTEQG